MTVYVMQKGTLVNPFGPPAKTVIQLLSPQHTTITKPGMFPVPTQWYPIKNLEVRVAKNPHMLDYIDRTTGKHLFSFIPDVFQRIMAQAEGFGD